jgi:K+/H+ antiporter YhaU regulatory subunit KhtT
VGALGETITVAALRRTDGTRQHLPSGDQTLAAGDTAYLIGPYEELLGMLGRR